MPTYIAKASRSRLSDVPGWTSVPGRTAIRRLTAAAKPIRANRCSLRRRRCWDWQVLPQGLIYRSYWAGVKEPRLGIQLMHIEGDHSFWDPTVGRGLALIRFGTTRWAASEGFEWDVEGAADPRLTLDRDRDLETVDFRAGTVLTYGVSNWQFKFGYYHLSSHLGDELAIKNPVDLAESHQLRSRFA